MKTIILATGNPNKTVELKALFGDDWQVLTMKEAGIDVDIVEDGDTFEDNALIKVRALAPFVKGKDVIVMGDDSGLCVDALLGRPGVYSARYAGEHVTYEDNNRKLLRELSEVPDGKRGATFVCAIAVLLPDGREWTGRGAIRGTIARDYRGEKGFGYDPLFVVDGVGKSFAQLGEVEKNKISHRGNAIRMAKAYISCA